MKRYLLLLLALPVLSSVLQADPFRALLFYDTQGYCHDSIPSGIEAIRKLSKLHRFNLFATQDARVMNDEGLEKYDVIIFLNTTGNILNEEQQAAVERFVQAGKGFVGIHSATDTEYEWEWYTKMLGHMFYTHPEIQSAMVQVEEPDFPGMDRFAHRFLFTEEWYHFRASLSDELHYLLSVDETSYRPQVRWGSKQTEGMGFHPVSWCHEFDGGRAFYTALGHLSATYEDPNFCHHLYGGIYWAATGLGFKVE